MGLFKTLTVTEAWLTTLTTPPLWKWFLGGVTLLAITTASTGARTNSKVYEPISSSNFCFRRFNGTHQVGCTSSLSGDAGVIHIVDDVESFNWVVKDGPHSPYIVALYPEDLNLTVMSKFKESDRVVGVLVLNSVHSRENLREFSADLKCPNEGFGLYANKTALGGTCKKWNTPGSGLMQESYNFPVFYVSSEDNTAFIIDCFEKFNKPINQTAREWPLCSAHLKSFMFGAVDTPTCLRRSNQFSMSEAPVSVCDPLGDTNIWSTLVPSNQADPYPDEGSVIVISARLDGFSFFDGLAPAADSAVTGIATLLSIVKQLSALKETLMNPLSQIKNVYFVLFNGEAFGYIGSSRLVYDMKRGKFPAGIGKNDTDVPALLNFKDIKYFIEIGQVGSNNSVDDYYLHQYNSLPVSNLVTSLVSEGAKLNLNLVPIDSDELPPSSLQSFLLERPDIPGLVVANHDAKEFKNKFYNSLYDDASRLSYKYKAYNSPSSIQSRIARLSATISNAVVKLIDNSSTERIQPDPELIDELLNCYLITANCTLFQNISDPALVRLLPNTTFDLYVGVDRYATRPFKPHTKITEALMMYFQGSIATNITTMKDCIKGKELLSKRNVDFQWINGSCYETTVNVSEGRSPAFLIKNYDWTSGKYSTWAESVWQSTSAQLFLKPSRTHEILTLVFGLLVFATSFVIVGFVSAKSDVIFPARPQALAC